MEDDSTDITSLECSHLNSSAFSGDLVCLTCGKVLQSNSQLSSEPPPPLPPFLDRPTRNPSTSTAAFISANSHKLSHQDREELNLKLLARKLISAFALKPSHETEALSLMHRYWSQGSSKQKYGLTGTRLLIAAIFLLARRDHLAVNLGLLAGSVDASAQDCGVFFDQLVKIDPSLRSLARVEDYSERAVDLLVSHLHRLHGLQILDSHKLKQVAQSIADLLQDSESGSSKSAEATALAASSLALDSLLRRDFQSIDLVASIVPQICEASNVSLKMVKIKRAALVEKLLERAAELLPSMFSLKMTRQRKLNLLLENLEIILQFT